MAKYKKDIDVLVRTALEQGWDVKKRGNDNHPVLYPKDKQFSPIPVPISLSDHRGYKNLRSECRKAGLNI